MAVEVIDKIKPKNGGSFPIVEAVDVAVTDKKRLPEALSEKADVSALAETNATVETKANTSDVTTATTNLQNQINNIITPVTQEAEVQNARVGTTGKSYTTLKERLDTEETSLKTNLDQLKTDSVIVDYMNRFDESSLTDGRVENDGSIIIYATYKHSDYIPVDSSKKYSVYRYMGGTTWAAPTIYSIATYDSDKNFIEIIGDQTYSLDPDSEITLNDDVAFIVLSFPGPEGYSNTMMVDYSEEFPAEYFNYTRIVKKKNINVLTPEMFGAVGDGVTDDTSAFNKMMKYITDEVCVCTNNYKISSLRIGNINFYSYGSLYCNSGIIIESASYKTVKIKGIYGASREYSTIYGVTLLNSFYNKIEIGEIDNFAYGFLIKADASNGCYSNSISIKRMKCIMGLHFETSDMAWANSNVLDVHYNPITIINLPNDVTPYAINLYENSTNFAYNSNIIHLWYEWHYQYLGCLAKIARLKKANKNRIIIERMEITGTTDDIEDIILFESQCERNSIIADNFFWISSEYTVKNLSNYLNDVTIKGVDILCKDFKWYKQDMMLKMNGQAIDSHQTMLRVNDNNAFEETDVGVSLNNLSEVWPIGTNFSCIVKDITQPSYIIIKARNKNARCNVRLGNENGSALGPSYYLTTENPYLNHTITFYNYKVNDEKNSSIFRSSENIAIVDSMLEFKEGVKYINLAICGEIDEIGLSPNLLLLETTQR